MSWTAKQLGVVAAAATMMSCIAFTDALANECGAKTKGNVPGLDKAAGTLKLGTTHPITGRITVIGLGSAEGVDIAKDAINARGGVDGCKLNVVTLDDQYTLDVTVASVRRLVDREKVWAIVGSLGSAYLPATYMTLQDSGTPMWGPISPGDKNVREVYLLAPTRTEQSRICFDYFANKGVKKVASLSQNNDIGVQSEDAMKQQAGIRGLKVAATEKIDIQAPNLSAPVLNVINSGAQGLLIALDPASLGTALNLLRDGGYKGLICSDGGSAGVGSLSNIGAANADAATGFLATMQTALPESEDPTVTEWRKLRESYNGRFKGGAANYSLQSYLYTMAFAELIHRLDGNYTRENFHKVAEGLKSKPIKLTAMPEVECGPLPGGHTCSTGAGLAIFDGHTKKWAQTEDFKRPTN